MSYDLPGSTPIPADIELPDKILAGLTARQVAIIIIIITAAAVITWAGFEASRRLVPLPVLAALAAPVAVAAAALVIGQRDGLSLDRLLIAAWRQARSPRRFVIAPGGIPAPPAWASPRLARRQGAPPAPLDPLYLSVASDGVIGLGDGGAAVAAAVATVNFALRRSAPPSPPHTRGPPTACRSPGSASPAPPPCSSPAPRQRDTASAAAPAYQPARPSSRNPWQ